MNITKYEHACLVVEEGGKKLVIDPGTFTTSLTDVSNVVGIVITHVHQDHFDKSLVEKILAASPEAKVYTVKPVADELAGKQVVIVKAGQSETVGPFELSFYGGDHALIHSSIPKAENVGVLVNKTLYYPGDSFTQPDGAVVSVLALPVTAPWLKIGESMDFLLAIKPKTVFPTHDGLHNDISEKMSNNLIGTLAKSQNITYAHLKSGDQLSV